MPDYNVVRGRFAPSPSGRMHLGNIYCALMVWLSVRSQKGEMLLRIEDLDSLRCTLENTRILEDDLRWLGLDWDEGGTDAHGPHAPYCQSRRYPFFEDCLAGLESLGLTYPCYCTRAESHAASAPHLSDGSVVYGGRCRNLSEVQRAALAAKRRPATRLAVPDQAYGFTDGRCGEYSENLAQSCGDFIIRRSDGVFAYQLAVVADDIAMGVTEIVRGRDLISSTPRQLYLYELFEARPPWYFHIPMLNAPDGRRLSKREKDLDVGELRDRYKGPEAVVGRLAWLCGLIGADEPVAARELVEGFDWSKITPEDIVIQPGMF